MDTSTTTRQAEGGHDQVYHDVQGLIDGDMRTRAQVGLHAIEIHEGAPDLGEDLREWRGDVVTPSKRVSHGQRRRSG
jgi:hypothetical protein